jgi:hypothetical protein
VEPARHDHGALSAPIPSQALPEEGAITVRLLPEGILQNQHTMAAVRLTHRERGLALEALQLGVVEASKVLNKIGGSKLDS